VSSDGRTGPWSNEVTHTVGQFKNYLSLDSVSVDLNSHFLIMKAVSEVELNPALFKFYEYRVYRNSGTGDFWDIVPDDTNQIKTIKVNSVAELNLLEFTGIRISESGVKYRIACRTVDIHDNYSDTSALTSILIKTIV
jgi:hypothetical protein